MIRGKNNFQCLTKDTRCETIQGDWQLQSQSSGNAEKLALAGRLAASFAHSVRNPLTSIKMRLYSLQQVDLPPDQKDDLEVIIEEMGSIENLVRNFLEFSRPVKMKQEKISPSIVVDNVIRLLGPDLECRNIGLYLERSRYLPEIWIDAEQLKEAIINLVINGSEAVGDVNGTVSISEKEVNQVPFGRSTIIEIHDNGNGIPESVQSKIFDPFFTTKDDGTGLGLSIAKQIVVAQGGEITFCSRENEGSVFTITLPCKI